MHSSVLVLALAALGGAAAFRPVPTTARARTALSAEAADGRRAFLNGLAAAGAAAAGTAAAGAYELPALPYDYAALEPTIDAATMKFHHDFHHQTYITGINGALEGKDQPPLADLQVGAIKSGVKGIRNSGGGAYNHDLFWEEMAPTGKGGAPSSDLAAAIDASFGSMDEFKKTWAAAAAPAARFGSGWVWLIVAGGKLAITDTPNQDNPLMKGVEGKEGIPILGLDVWEHAVRGWCKWCRALRARAHPALSPLPFPFAPSTTSSTRTAAPSTWARSGKSSTGTRSASGTPRPWPAAARRSFRRARRAQSRSSRGVECVQWRE